MLKFFDDYRYDRIGIACRLENDVCTMSGIEPAGMGFYLVKGRGVPRIDIIGNRGGSRGRSSSRRSPVASTAAGRLYAEGPAPGASGGIC